MRKINQQDQEYLRKNIPLLQKLKGSVRAINQFRKIYNDLCINCKIKCVRNPRMDVSLYCKTCRDKIQPRLELIKGLLK